MYFDVKRKVESKTNIRISDPIRYDIMITNYKIEDDEVSRLPVQG